MEVKFEKADVSIDTTNAFNMELSPVSISGEIQDIKDEIKKVE